MGMGLHSSGVISQLSWRVGARSAMQISWSSANSDPTLGRDLINHLRIIIQGSAPCNQNAVGIVSVPLLVSTVHALMLLPNWTTQQTDCTIQIDYTSMLREFLALELPTLGHSPGSQHHIKLKLDAIPVAHHAHPIPLALHNNVNKAIQDLDRQGIWEPFDKLEWALRIVTPMRPTGEVCITTGFHPLNDFMVPICFLLPVPEELFQWALGSKSFSLGWA